MGSLRAARAGGSNGQLKVMSTHDRAPTPLPSPTRITAGHGNAEPAYTRLMPDVLHAIDHVLDGLCPCGSTPRPGNPYCGDDCTPTHRGPHSTSHAMRWSPHLGSLPDQPGLRVSPETVAAIRATFANMHTAIRAFTEAMQPALAALRQIHALAQATGNTPLPKHPLARVNAQRTNRTHGPQRQHRPPRQIGPGGRR